MTRADARAQADLVVGRLLAVRPGEQLAVLTDAETEAEMLHALVAAGSPPRPARTSERTSGERT